MQTILAAKTPDFISVTNPEGKKEALTPKQFNERFHVVLSEGLDAPEGFKVPKVQERIQTTQQGKDKIHALRTRQLQQLLKSDWAENFEIRYMGNGYGYGVFAAKDISDNTVVAIISGTLAEGVKSSGQDANQENIAYLGSDLYVSTIHHRGITSFMQHLPEKFSGNRKNPPKIPDYMCVKDSETHFKLEFEVDETIHFSSNEIKKQIARENLKTETLNYKNVPVMVMVTSQQIKKGEPVGYNYGCGYWVNRNACPAFFDKGGALLAHSLYKRTFGHLNFGSCRYTGEFKPLLDLVREKKFIELKDTKRTFFFIEITGDNKQVYKIFPMQLIVALIKANAGTLQFDSRAEEAIEKNRGTFEVNPQKKWQLLDPSKGLGFVKRELEFVNTNQESLFQKVTLSGLVDGDLSAQIYFSAKDKITLKGYLNTIDPSKEVSQNVSAFGDGHILVLIDSSQIKKMFALIFEGSKVSQEYLELVLQILDSKDWNTIQPLF